MLTILLILLIAFLAFGAPIFAVMIAGTAIGALSLGYIQFRRTDY